MSVVDPYSQYLENQAMTATPGKLLIMTYDGAVRFARAAIQNIQDHKLDEQSVNITRTQNILLELMASLNHKVDARLCADLDSLYTYMFDRLTHANLRDDIEAIEEVIGILNDLRSAWVEAELAVRAGNSATGGTLAA